MLPFFLGLTLGEIIGDEGWDGMGMGGRNVILPHVSLLIFLGSISGSIFIPIPIVTFVFLPHLFGSRYYLLRVRCNRPLTYPPYRDARPLRSSSACSVFVGDVDVVYVYPFAFSPSCLGGPIPNRTLRCAPAFELRVSMANVPLFEPVLTRSPFPRLYQDQDRSQ